MAAVAATRQPHSFQSRFPRVSAMIMFPRDNDAVSHSRGTALMPGHSSHYSWGGWVYCTRWLRWAMYRCVKRRYHGKPRKCDRAAGRFRRLSGKHRSNRRTATFTSASLGHGRRLPVVPLKEADVDQARRSFSERNFNSRPGGPATRRSTPWWVCSTTFPDIRGRGNLGLYGVKCL